MKAKDAEALKNWLSRLGALDRANEDLINNAIWCLENSYDARAEISLKGLVSNLKNSGKADLAREVEKQI